MDRSVDRSRASRGSVSRREGAGMRGAAPLRSVARVVGAPHAPSNKMALLYPRETPIFFKKTRPFFFARAC